MSTSSSVEDLKQELGTPIYEKVMEMFPGDENEPLWGKITGMLVESIDLSELRDIVSDETKLVSKIKEAYKFYREHVKMVAVDDEEQQRFGIVLSSDKSSKLSIKHLTPAQTKLYSYKVLFSGQKVLRDGKDDKIKVCDDMAVFVEFRDLILQAEPHFPMPILNFLEFVFSSNHVFHTLPEYQTRDYDNARAFYIRLIINFISSIKFCLVKKVRFDMERYMRSSVFVSSHVVLSGPFLRIWDKPSLRPFHSILSTLYREVEEFDIARRRNFAKKAAYDAIYPSLEESDKTHDSKKGGKGGKKGGKFGKKGF